MAYTAIAVNGGHVSRALDFYDAVGKYFILGGTTAWTNESSPTSPSPNDFRLNDVIGLKKVDNCYMVVPDEDGTIKYRDQNWRIVPDRVSTTLTSAIANNGTTFTVANLEGIVVGSKLRINSRYEGTVVSITGADNTITLNTPAPQSIPNGSPVIGGAIAEGAKYVYVECWLNYDQFPVTTYRQIGLCTGVTPNTQDVLKSAAFTVSNQNEYTSLGVLEVLDNRIPSTRDMNQREQISLIIQF